MDPSNAPPHPSQLGSLIRPEQVRRLPHLTEEAKIQQEAYITRLWQMINNSQQNSQDWMRAFKNLREVSASLMSGIKRFNQRQGQGQGQQQHNMQQQQMQAQMQAQQGGMVDGDGRQNAMQQNGIYPEVMAQVNAIKFALPPTMVEGSQQAKDWLREARNRFAQATQRHEGALRRKQDLQRTFQQRQQAQTLTPQESEAIRQKLAQCERALLDATSFLTKFKNQQKQFHEGQQARFERDQQQSAPTEAAQQPEPPIQQNNPNPAQTQGQKQNQPQNQAPNQQPPGVKPLTISAAVTAARESLGAPAEPNSPETSAAIQADQAAGGMSHKLTQANVQSHAHPQIINTTFTNPKNEPGRIPKNLNVPPPRPVQMAPSRPTLNGGPGVGVAGQMSKPTMPVMPGYVLENGEGDGDGRTMSKTKLHELAREVCGPGGDSVLTPEAEEVRLLPPFQGFTPPSPLPHLLSPIPQPTPNPTSLPH